MIAEIVFSNNESLIIKDTDFIVPVKIINDKKDNHVTFGTPINLTVHHKHGLILPIIDCLNKCDFFYVNENNSIAYNKHSIVSIKCPR